MEFKMKFKVFILSVILTSILLVACRGGETEGGEGHGEHESSEPEVIKGPHGGRLLSEGDFSVEVTIFEKGVPPEFRIFFYEDEKELAPSDIQLTIELERFGGVKNVIEFKAVDNYLLGTQEIVEPHSFVVTVLANYKSKSYRFQYESYEGRTQLTPTAIKNAGIVIEQAGPARIKSTLNLSGRISPNEDRLLHVTPRYPGVIRELKKRLGDSVDKDEVLATVESNESLQRYEIKSSFSGTVIEKKVSIGEFVQEGDSLYTVSDLSTVWADFLVYRSDYKKVKLGQPVTVSSMDKTLTSEGKVSYLAPIADQSVQAMLLRVELPNPTGEWQQGIFATAQVEVEEAEVPVAVKADAIQKFRDWDVVFMNDRNVFEIAILEVGRQDKEFVEVLSGLKAGQPYVTENSFIIKADIGKSGASHDH